MAFTLSPNMNLQIPGVGTEAGPLYATEINTTLITLDRHDHTQGNGVQITPAAININSNLPFNNNFATNIAGLTLIAQTVVPVSSTIYQSGNDLFFVDGLGANVRLTQNSAVAGTPGSIANLVSPASASYVAGSQTFVWQSLVGIAANMDFGSAILRNLTPNSTYSLTLQPPTLTSSYTLTLPVIPAQVSFMTMDNTGAMRTDIPTIGALTTSNLSANANITGSQLSPMAGIVGTQLVDHTITARQLEFGIAEKQLRSQAFSGNGTFTVPAGVTNVIVTGYGGGGGGTQGTPEQTFGSSGGGIYYYPPQDGHGGGAAIPGTFIASVTPGQVLTVVIGAGGGPGADGGVSRVIGVSSIIFGGSAGGAGSPNGQNSPYSTGGLGASTTGATATTGGIASGGGAGYGGSGAAGGGPGYVIISWVGV